MHSSVDDKLAMMILQKAEEFGVDLAGFVVVESMATVPAHKMLSQMPIYEVMDFSEEDTNAAPNEHQTVKFGFALPSWAETILVIALKHPEDNPSLDYFSSSSPGGSEGNLQLIRINNKIIKWLEESENIKGKQLPYALDRGGIALKDAAALAGLGVIGKNNMLVTPQFGPRVRFRAMALPVKLPSTGPLDYDPCLTCDIRCRESCPQKAFENQVYDPGDHGQFELPAREGVYDREKCALESDKRLEQDGSAAKEESVPIVSTSCRVCEFACPVGSQ